MFPSPIFVPAQSLDSGNASMNNTKPMASRNSQAGRGPQLGRQCKYDAKLTLWREGGGFKELVHTVGVS